MKNSNKTWAVAMQQEYKETIQIIDNSNYPWPEHLAPSCSHTSTHKIQVGFIKKTDKSKGMFWKTTTTKIKTQSYFLR